MEKIEIRYAETTDYPGIERIMEQVHRLHVEWRPDLYKSCVPLLSREEFEEKLREREILTAVRGEEVAGFLIYLIRRVQSPAHVERAVLFIDAVAVEESLRRRGIGTRLLDFARKIQREKKLDGLELKVNAENKDAFRMYQKYGFREKTVDMELI